MRILIIEDDFTLSQNITGALRSEGMAVEAVFDGLLAGRMLRKETFDCIVMDINLPGKNGYALCGEFRAYNEETPVLMLTAFADLDDKVQGFECGADDYLTKPFFMRELVLRIQTLVKRRRLSKSGNSSQITVGDLVILPGPKKVLRQGVEVSLTPREYQILLTLAEQPGTVVSKDELVKKIWGSTLGFNTNTIEVYINFLRNKLDKPFQKNSIKTRVGYGYYLDV